MTMDKKKLAGILIIPLTLILLAFLIKQTSIQDILNALSLVSPAFVLLSFILYIFLNLTRATRFSVMLKNPGNIGSIFNIVCIHNLANSVMPFRTGEFAFVYLAKVRLNTAMGIGVATVTLARVFDVLGVCLVFILSLSINRDYSGVLSGVTPLVMSATIVLIVMIILAIWFSQYFVAFIGRISEVNYLKKLPLLYVRSKMEEVSKYYSSRESKRNLIKVLFLSMAIWVIYSILVFLLIMGIGIGLNVWTVIVGVLISVIFTSLPVQGVGNFGSFELIWSVIFVTLGANKDVAVSSGFAVHIMMLTFAIVLWVYATASDRFISHYKNKERPSPAPTR